MSAFGWNVLDLDYETEAERICTRLREITSRTLHKRGLVVATSGGIDSSVSCALAVRALGPERVFTLFLPERDSQDDSAVRSRMLVEHLKVKQEVFDIAPTLAAIGCYAARDAAVKKTLPAFGEGWKMKIVIAGGTEGRVNHFNLIARAPDGEVHERRLGLAEYLQIVASTNHKQRVRKTLEYYHADRLNYAVVGTPNRLEYDQGFFVKNGDGAADVKPIAHLYKTQVFGMAKHLGLPEKVATAEPTTDTYSLPQGQDEFYFALPHRSMDLALWAFEHEVPASELGKVLGIDTAKAEAVYTDIVTKRRTTEYLHMAPVLVVAEELRERS